jgi:hypothetical protein
MDLNRPELIAALMFMTLLAVLGWLFWQNYSVRRSMKKSGLDPDSPDVVPQPGSLDERRRREARGR